MKTIPQSVLEIAIRRAIHGYWSSWFECESFLRQWIDNRTDSRDLTVVVFDSAKKHHENPA